ncbi:hypothetical protein BH24DEI2_BH24DEI2_06450 [soil metagenome]
MLGGMKYLSLAFALLLVGCTAPSAARLGVSRQALALQGNTPEAAFFVSNEGAASTVLEWQIDAPELNVTPREGRLLGGASVRVVVRLTASEAAPTSTLQSVLTVDSNGGRTTVTVSYDPSDNRLPSCARPGTAAPSPPGTVSSALGDPASYVPGELLVRFAAPALTPKSLTAERRALTEVATAVATAVAADYRFTLVGPVQPERPTLVRVPVGKNAEALARTLATDPRVVYAEPNYYLETSFAPSYIPSLIPAATPNDPRLGDQWNLLDFGLPQAWALETGAPKPGAADVVVAVIDSGVDTEHIDLKQKTLPGYDFFENDPDPRPGPKSPEPDHGTHVSGIALATGDNATGVAGVAYGAGVKLLPIKVFPDAPGTGDINALLNALLWAAGLDVPGFAKNPYPARIINMSLGVRPADTKTNTLKAVDDVTKRVFEHGVVMFAAVGNDGASTFIRSPASSPWVCAVGSVGGDYRRSSFSDYAANGESVDFMAPGGLKTGSFCGSILSTFVADEYGCLAGTSMASPFVAGVAALVLSQTPSLRPEQLIAELADGALFEPYMSAPEYGAGVVCADRILGAVTLCGRAP